MKSILKFGIAAVLSLSLANSVFAAAGDAFLFSISNTDPNAGTTLTKVGTGATAPLYIWVTSSAAADDITPASTALTGGGSPTGSAALALNGTVTTTTGLAIGTLQYYTPSYTGSIARWSATSGNVTGGTSFTNFEANTAMQSPAGVTYPAGTVTGLGRSSVGDPMYFPAAVVANGSTGGAWLLGEITFNASAAGTSTIALAASSLDITKSGPSTTTVLTSAYSFGSGTVTITNNVLNGDTNGDHVVNAQDYVNVVNNLGNTGPTGGPPNGPLGDTNPFDGVVNAQDYVNVLNNLGATGGAGSSPQCRSHPRSLCFRSLALFLLDLPARIVARPSFCYSLQLGFSLDFV